MSDKLAELQTRRKELAKTIEQKRQAFSAAGDKWKDEEERKGWEKLNADFDQSERDIEQVRAAADVHTRANQIREDDEKRNHTPNGKTGRMPGQEDPDVRRGNKPAPPSEETRVLALQGWVRNHCDKPLSRRHRQAMAACRMNPQARRVQMPCMPTAQRRCLAVAYRSGPSYSAESRALSAITPNAGGELIAQSFMTALEINQLAFGPMLLTSDTIRTETGADLPWPTADDTTNEGEIIGENLAQNNADPTFGAVVFRAWKFSSKFIKVPWELLEDSAFNLAVELGRIIGERLGRIKNRRFTTGTGAGQPRGIVTAATSGLTTASATAIADTEIIRLIHSVDPAYRTQGCGFMAHDNIWLAIRQLKDSQGRFIWVPGLSDGQLNQCLGFPTFTNQHMDSTVATTKKTLLFGQLNKYKVREVGQLRLKRLVERFADTDQEGFIGLNRADGNLLDAGTAPVKFLTQA